MTKPAGSKILITGFGAFPGVPHNVSADLAEAVAERARAIFADIHVETDILPVDWIMGPRRVTDRLAKFSPDIAIHLGVSADAYGFKLETCALNVCRQTTDCAGNLPALTILTPSGAASRTASLPFEKIAARLMALGLPVSLSDDAGGYLCNAVFYESLMHRETANPRRIAGFVHIPRTLDGPPLNFEQAVTGGLEIVRCALEAAQG